LHLLHLRRGKNWPFEKILGAAEPFIKLVDISTGRLSQSAFPDDCYSSTCLAERLDVPSIPLHVFPEFSFPFIDITCRRRRKRAACMPVPETPMNEYSCLESRKHHVWPAGHILNVKPESESGPMQTAAHEHLGLGIPSPDPRHHSRARLLLDYVHSLIPPAQNFHLTNCSSAPH